MRASFLQHVARKLFLGNCLPLSDFAVVGRLGKGAYAVVLLAEDRAGNRVALKRLTPTHELKKTRQPLKSDRSVISQTFLRELSNLMQMDHPNVLKVEGLVVEEGEMQTPLSFTDVYSLLDRCPELFLCLEVADSDLAALIDDPDTDLEHDAVRCYARNILEGLAYLHSRGVVHRDVKPSNVFLKDGVVKLGDFGLSRKEAAVMTQHVTTLWYRAPEVLLGDESYNSKIDVWSAGCVIAEMILRRPLMPGRNETDQLQAIDSTLGPLDGSPKMRDLCPSLDRYRNSMVRFRSVMHSSLRWLSRCDAKILCSNRFF
ncbi:MAG: hypothetical protein KVP17_001687 [Porospora cf. gigantea B]|uniref:uncharacterized protein n=1 Tax=Porospora cf. gigantea B TaxID=2853592 RepID=UPI003571C363|nr:MAG: hypothetical protein KVP17_001687 [Porospora cf. gigantea B]